MIIDHKRYLISGIVLFLMMFTLSCSGKSGEKGESRTQSAPALKDDANTKLIRLVSPEENSGFKLKSPVKVVLAPENTKKLPDSVSINFDGKAVKTITSEPWEYSVPPDFTITTGRKSLKVTSYRGGKPGNTITRFMIIYSDIAPERFGYKVINGYPHDKNAFTQGLLFDNGSLYESTGQESESSLREVELETGRVIRQHNMESSLFGEGITLYHDRIYQVTWTNKVGFIYEKSTFRIVNKVYYPMQGWGLATINDRIIMSDGSNVLYYFEPEMFTVVSTIEVYDNEKEVDSLNELEYINGEIWANIWMTDLIARIDPVSGKVIAYINLTGILPEREKTPNSDVLNGIAYDSARDRIFVTGKKWPKLYEIKLTE